MVGGGGRRGLCHLLWLWGLGLGFFVSVCWELWDGELAWVCFGKVVHFGSGPEASEGVREWILMEEEGGRFLGNLRVDRWF